MFVTAAATHRFEPAKYPYTFRYDGLALPKHYYEVIGDLKNDGEEYDCARVIAHLGAVEFWVRNLEGEPDCSFWIQTSTDKFYPDFVCKLKNAKYLAVEYKGLDRATTDDTKEKERLGELWEARSSGQCLFMMVKGPNELSKIADAAARAMSAGPGVTPLSRLRLDWMRMLRSFLAGLLFLGIALAVPAADVSSYTKHIAPLIDPAKLATLGERGANPRVKKYVAQLAEARRAGVEVSTVVSQAVTLAGMKGEAAKLT